MGKYQLDVETLTPLSLTAYERIFKIYNVQKESKEFLFYNILKKIEIPDIIDDELLSYYNVRSNMALTIVSHKIYGDMSLWWLVFLLNNKVLNDNRFVVPGGTQLRYIKPEFLSTILSQISRVTQNNGRHFN